MSKKLLRDHNRGESILAGQRDSFTLWKRLTRDRARQRESERQKLLSRVVEALDQLAMDFSWEELYIFGSLIKPGRFHPESDVDVAVRGLSKFDHFAFVGELSMLIERPVDVVLLEDCPFAAAIVSKGLKWQRKEI